MLNIVTGKKNSGKTTYLKNFYTKTQKGDGFLSLKYFENGNHVGYDILHLKTGHQVPFIRQNKSIPANWIQIFEIGTYSFSKEGFDFANDIISKNNQEAPIYIDEIGPLEIHHHSGFYNLLKSQLNTDLYVTVREELYEEFLHTFNISEKIKKITID